LAVLSAWYKPDPGYSKRAPAKLGALIEDSGRRDVVPQSDRQDDHPNLGGRLASFYPDLPLQLLQNAS
jgi:hypothetical protein